jgi:hypothetical protein
VSRTYWAADATVKSDRETNNNHDDDDDDDEEVGRWTIIKKEKED